MPPRSGVTVAELNRLELTICRVLDWKLMPDLDSLAGLRLALMDDPLALGSAWSNWLQLQSRHQLLPQHHSFQQ